jgi:hypothetical protein
MLPYARSWFVERAGQPRIISADSVDPSVVVLLKQKKALERAMDATQRLADNLDEQKRIFAERFPDQKPTLDRERREDRKRIEEAWASIQAGEPMR